MALSRPFVLAIIGALLSAATFVSLQSASQNASASDDQAAPVVTGVPAPKSARTTPSTTTKQPADKPATTPAKKAKPAKKKAADTGLPPRVKRALDSKAVVVLFFRQPAADDDATAKAVAQIKGKGVKVFSDRISRLSRYRRAVSNLGITQAPAIAIVGKDRKARVIEGYVDGGTLKQAIRDAR